MSSAAQSAFTFLFKFSPRTFSQGRLALAPVMSATLLIVGLAVLAVLVILAVRRLRGVTRTDRIVLAVLRIAIFVVLAACLLRPVLALSTAVPQRNVLAIALDDSRSMQIRDVDSSTRIAAVRRLFDDSTALVKALADRYALRFFRFGSAAAPVAGAAALSASGSQTDLASALRTVRDQLADAPVAGVVLVSDGADNGESDLGPALTEYRLRQVPVYTVGVGSERFARDLSIERLVVPATTLRGSGAVVTATIGMHGVSHDSVVVTAEADGRIVTRVAMVPTPGREVLDVPLQIAPLAAGDHAISVHIRPMPGEAVIENNDAEALLRVRGGVERVLYVEGEPRFEFAFLRRAFAADSAVRLVGLLRSAKEKFLRVNVVDSLDLVSGFPSRREELFRYRALMVGNIEASFFTGDQLRMIAEFVDRRGGTLLVLGGRSALAEGGYAGTPVGDVLPVVLAATRSADTSLATLKVEPTADGLLHPALRLGPSASISSARWDSLPAVTAVNRIAELRPGATLLLSGRSATGRTSPVLALQRYGRGVAAVLGVQDTWTWKMDPHSSLDNRSFQDFWRQLIRWGLDQVPDQVELTASPQRVGPGESVSLRARVSDSAYAPVNDAAVRAEVTTPSGKSDSIPLAWTMRNDGSYEAHYVAAEQGIYRFSVATLSRRDTIRSNSSAFLADARGADMDHAELRSDLLRRIATETGGKYYTTRELPELPADVMFTRSGIVARETHDLWDMPVMLLAMITLLGADWGFRRWRGLA